MPQWTRLVVQSKDTEIDKEAEKAQFLADVQRVDPDAPVSSVRAFPTRSAVQNILNLMVPSTYQDDMTAKNHKFSYTYSFETEDEVGNKTVTTSLRVADPEEFAQNLANTAEALVRWRQSGTGEWSDWLHPENSE